ncbi:MAG: GntR family transcriptional regulator, partial [Lentisphaerae bacterium]|nr:GntR family transcriptional regulator [Lentisphaerota bacterium]
MLGYRDIAALMEKRIRHGDYNFKPLPTERALSREMEVSQKTARRALLELEGLGLIERKPHSRPQLRNGGQRVLALLAPLHTRSAAPSSMLTSSSALWESRANVAAEAAGFTLQPAFYRHWDDPQIAEALET